MFFWIREIAGWLLVLCSFYVVGMGIDYLNVEKPIQASALFLLALGVLRAGILLVRVSTAARICLKEDRPAQRS